MATNNPINSAALGTASAQSYTTSTWSPTIGDGTNNFAMSTQLGSYTQIGDVITFTLQIVWTTKGSAGSSSNIRISLPSAPTRSFGFFFGKVEAMTHTATSIIATGSNGQSYISLYESPAAGATPIQKLVSDFTASGKIELSGWYW